MKYYLSLLIIALLFICQACEKKDPKPEETPQDIIIRIENYAESRNPLYVRHHYQNSGKEEVIRMGYFEHIHTVVGAKLTLRYVSEHPEIRPGLFSINNVDHTLDMRKDTTFTVTLEHDYR